MHAMHAPDNARSGPVFDVWIGAGIGSWTMLTVWCFLLAYPLDMGYARFGAEQTPFRWAVVLAGWNVYGFPVVLLGTLSLAYGPWWLRCLGGLAIATLAASIVAGSVQPLARLFSDLS